MRLSSFSLLPVLVSCLAVPALSAHTESPAEIVGAPVVQDTGYMIIDGQTIALWGVILLDNDQQCWTKDQSWPCGEEALLTLKHIVENRRIVCRFQSASDEGTPAAQCSCQKGPHAFDVARFMVRHGWALADSDESGGYYENDEDWAREQKRGIWSSRFQMPEDWREGASRFVGDANGQEGNSGDRQTESHE